MRQAPAKTLLFRTIRYVNLYGYGYRTVYELHELVNVNDPRITFEGTIVARKPAPPAPPVAK